MSTCQNSLAQNLDKRGNISVLIEDLHITYEAGPKLNEAKLQGSASSALGNIQYTYVRLFTASPYTNTTRTQQPGPAALLVYCSYDMILSALFSGRVSRASSALAGISVRDPGPSRDLINRVMECHEAVCSTRYKRDRTCK